METGKLCGLKHLFATVFLYNFSAFMVIPAITDVTMSALCPGRDECSLAIYLSGFQQAMIGVGTLFFTPMLGHLSDIYGRKLLLTLPLSLGVVPSVILACGMSKGTFYAYYGMRTLTAMVCEGSFQCVTLAYVADNVPEPRRASVFGILSGVGSSAFLCATLSARVIATSDTFKVAALVGLIAFVYMRAFMPASIECADSTLRYSFDVEGASSSDSKPCRVLPSPLDIISLLRTSKTFSQTAIVALLGNMGDAGLRSALMYYLKARLHFQKNQFADLMAIAGVAGTVSQLILMPLLIPTIGEEKLLSIGLLFSFTHMLLYSIAWSAWVPYVAAMFSIFMVFAYPCMRSIVSKQAGPDEQGRAQGCISGICAFADIISPLIFSPLTALFLSDQAPFDFPGFSITCIGFVSMVAFLQSLAIKAVPPIVIHGDGRHNHE